MSLLRRILLSVVIALVFWFLYQLGVLLGALTTERSPFYFWLHARLAWVFTVIVGVGAFNLKSGDL